MYSAMIPGTDNGIYIVPCTIVDNNCIEIYVVDDKGRANELCNTMYLSPALTDIVGELYKAAGVSSENVCLNDSVKDIIRVYQKKRNKNGSKD